ncbi:MAG: ribonuclease HII [Elusimicrobia bacterium]|nr:ribonuclease HII [Elusimicrobiota bacterium]
METRGHLLFRYDQEIIPSGKVSKRYCLIGMDEAGRGPWAGPVVACALTLSPGFYEPRIDDSKKLNPLSEKIKENSSWAIGLSEVSVIDSINILQATWRAMRNALQNLLRKHPHIKPDLVLIDGPRAPEMGFSQKTIVKGDSKSASIAAASILAKVERDTIMRHHSQEYPQYGFDRHKGYGTALHRKNLRKFGPCPIHRKSFAPVREVIAFPPSVTN